MATHSSVLDWRIPWTEEPGGLQSTGLQSRTSLKRLSTHTQLINNPVLASGVQVLASVIHIQGSILKIFSHLACYRILSRVHCVVESVLVGYHFISSSF